MGANTPVHHGTIVDDRNVLRGRQGEFTWTLEGVGTVGRGRGVHEGQTDGVSSQRP